MSSTREATTIKPDKDTRRILVVDDEVDVAYTMKKVLEESGLFEVDSFTDPELALSTFSPKRYDLVISDIRMPKIDGFELYKRIKIIDDKVKVCFFILSS